MGEAHEPEFFENVDAFVSMVFLPFSRLQVDNFEPTGLEPVEYSVTMRSECGTVIVASLLSSTLAGLNAICAHRPLRRRR